MALVPVERAGALKPALQVSLPVAREPDGGGGSPLRLALANELA